MINGVPVNDMEAGTVYWSNWAGLSDVTRTMQVQRGLGASKIAIPSLEERSIFLPKLLMLSREAMYIMAPVMIIFQSWDSRYQQD